MFRLKRRRYSPDPKHCRRESVVAAKAVVGKLSRRLQVRVLSGAPLYLYNNGLSQLMRQNIQLTNVYKLAVYGERSSVGRAPDCDSGGRGFKPHRSPH